MNSLVMIVAIVSTAGCSHQAIYDYLMMNEQRQCHRLRDSEYLECIDRTKKSYQQYETERKETVNSTEKREK